MGVVAFVLLVSRARTKFVTYRPAHLLVRHYYLFLSVHLVICSVR
jgi:hypothetical protein